MITVSFRPILKKINFISLVFGSIFPLLLLLLRVTQSLWKNPELKPLKLLFPNWGVHYYRVFSDRKTFQQIHVKSLKLSNFATCFCHLSPDNQISPQKLFLPFSLMPYKGVHKLKTIRQIFPMLVILKNYEYLTLREKCPNTELFLVRICLYSDWIQRFTE